ncbi:MAG: T9SS type B sorting domain-containing protein [Saprospiraceae bacterium]
MRIVLFFILLGFGLNAQAQSPYDECINAFPLGAVEQYCSSPGEFTSVGATTSPQVTPFCHPDTMQQDVWFSFIATATDVSIQVIGSLPRDGGGTITNPQFALYDGSCSNGTELACASDAFDVNVVETFADELIPGNLYFIRVGARDEVEGSFQLCVEMFNYVPEPQSDCIDGVLLCDKSPFTVTNLIGAGDNTNEIDLSSCIQEEFSSVWYRWTCEQSGSLGFVLTPNNPVDDLDFAVFELPGGIEDCAGKESLRCMASGENISSPLADWERCSGQTGLLDSDADIEEQPGCAPGDNNFANSIQMVAGRSYALIVNNFTNTGNGFSITWTGTGTFVGPKASFTVDPESGSQCDIDNLEFVSTSTLTPGATGTYDWFFGNFASPNQTSGQGPHEIMYEGFGEKTITLRLTSSDGCVVTESRKIFIESCCEQSEPLEAGIPLTIDPLCPGTATGSFDIPVVSGVPQYFFSVDGGPYLPDSESLNLLAGEYTVYLQNIKGCEDTVTLELIDPPVIEIEIGEDRTVDLGESFRVRSTINLSGIFDYEWTGVDSIVCLDPDCTEVEVFAYNSGELTLQTTDESGCFVTDLLRIDVRKIRPLYAPTAFSPNGDANNDLWTLFGPNVLERINYIRIFDRWGNFVWEGNDLTPNDVSQGWDGTMKGRPMDPAVFAWVAEVLYIDGEALVVSGDINLIK